MNVEDAGGNLRLGMADEREQRTLWAAVLALGLHALVLVGASKLAQNAAPARLARGLSASKSAQIEVDFASSRHDSATDIAAEGSGQRVASLSQSRLVGRNAGSPGRESEEPTAIEPGPSDVPNTETPEPRRFSLEELGIGSSAPLLRGHRPEREPNPAEVAARRVERSLVEGFAKHDRELGLGSDGPVISVLEKAVYGSDLPGNGNALFVARIDSSGRLSFLDVLETNGARAGWTAVARRAVGVLGKKKLRLPSGSRGVELKIRVSSREVMPSGADPGLEVSLLDIPLQKGRGKRSAKLSLLAIQWLEIPLPDGKKIRVPVGINPIAGGGDVADIGSHPRRVVHAHVESQTVL